MAWSAEQLEALEKAIAQGTKRVEYEGKVVEHRSLAEMLQLRTAMRRELGLSAPQDTNRVKTEFSKGLGS